MPICRCSPLLPQPTVNLFSSYVQLCIFWHLRFVSDDVHLQHLHYVKTRMTVSVLFQGHSAEIICLSFNTLGDRIITGSFDHTVAVWDVEAGRYSQFLRIVNLTWKVQKIIFIIYQFNLKCANCALDLDRNRTD